MAQNNNGLKDELRKLGIIFIEDMTPEEQEEYYKIDPEFSYDEEDDEEEDDEEEDDENDDEDD